MWESFEAAVILVDAGHVQRTEIRRLFEAKKKEGRLAIIKKFKNDGTILVRIDRKGESKIKVRPIGRPFGARGNGVSILFRPRQCLP